MKQENGIQVEVFEIKVPRGGSDDRLLSHFRRHVEEAIPAEAVPVRFVVTKTDANYYHCEVGCVIYDKAYSFDFNHQSIFELSKRPFESTREFNVALIIPTGIGLEIGGHAGDSGPVAKLFGKICDNLILHPNVVNASDINEMTENTLYIEGSVLSRLLMGTVGLNKVRANRVLTIIEGHDDDAFVENAVNAINAARATYGLNNDQIAVLWPCFEMDADVSESGSAVGHIHQMERLFSCLEHYKGKYDAVALASIIGGFDEGDHKDYFIHSAERVNPWGGPEAMLTHAISHFLNIQSAHAPLMESEEIMLIDPGVVDPRIAAEVVSTAYINCVLKGLQRSPRIVVEVEQFSHPDIITARDIDCIVIPDNCLGLPVLAALEQGMKVIAINNNNLMENDIGELPWSPDQFFYADSYAEAAGIAQAIKYGIDPRSLTRPIAKAGVDLFNLDDKTGQVKAVPFDSDEAERLEFDYEVHHDEFDYEVEIDDNFLKQEHRKNPAQKAVSKQLRIVS